MSNSDIEHSGAQRNVKAKTVLITGGGTGVGLECAKLFAQQEAKILLVGRDSKKLQAAQDLLYQSYGAEVHCLTGDVSDPTTADRAMAYAQEIMHSPVDILINNAGAIVRADACNTSDEQWRQVIDININGVFYFSRAAANQMKDGGAIINLSSTCGSMGSAGLAAYCASKGAVNMLTKTMALELAGRRINVNAVAPGAINSPMLFSKHQTQALADSVIERNLASIPIGAVAQPEEVARSILFLATEPHITGEILAVDGGYTAG
jgi:NAD(P)-dependent dehydrogenase (short-subunit alcohol dehydrogenase family)